jgi:hypothetical protein
MAITQILILPAFFRPFYRSYFFFFPPTSANLFSSASLVK